MCTNCQKTEINNKGEIMNRNKGKERVAWRTPDEKNYIKKIGQYAQNTVSFGKINLLKGYLRACLKRVHWGNLHKKEIIDFATEELNRLSAL
jgi:hypothetical protein